ncbi:MAG TPA: nickel pincer cofactor biosynthesis protein LarC [Deltaproteobacteria bacterium]|nr:nickel pincer cofactor biosynthesis protein LarC [Deltaproteobacteria bacterium]
MSKIAYFDCFSGISGDMVVGALLDLGLDLGVLKREVKKLPLKNYTLNVVKDKRHSITGTNFNVKVGKGHNHRTYLDIKNMIEKSKLKQEVMSLSLKIFSRIAHAEAKVHNCKVNDVHFHEVGAVDSIVDIVGTAIGICVFGIDKVYASPPLLGSGTVKTSHGMMPVPAPATFEILKDVPVERSNIKHELTTPTGAAIIKTLAEDFGNMPDMVICMTGYGVGDNDFKEIPNLLRIIIGEIKGHPAQRGQGSGRVPSGCGQEERLIMLETDIDDMNPQIYEYVMEKLFNEGALDVFLTPIQMKKGRPAVLLNCLCEEDKKDKLLEIIFRETSSIGIRIYPVDRHCLERKIEKVATKYGKINVKVSYFNGKAVNIQPEYEDCKKIAREKKVPLKAVLLEAQKEGSMRVPPGRGQGS